MTRRDLLPLLTAMIVFTSCTLVTKLDDRVARDSGGSDGDGDADSDGDGDADSDSDVDADSDSDVDGDVDIDEDRDSPPLDGDLEAADADDETCRIDFEPGYTDPRPSGGLFSLSFADFDGNGYPEAVGGGVQISDVGFALLFRDEVFGPERAYQVDFMVQSYPDRKVHAALPGNFDEDDDAELLLFTTTHATRNGKLLIVDEPHLTDPDVAMDVSETAHGLLTGILLHFHIEDRNIDIAALARDEETGMGYLYSWARDTSSTVWRGSPPGEVALGEVHPEHLAAADVNHDGDEELIVSIVDPPQLRSFDWESIAWGFMPLDTVDLPHPPVHMAAGDIDGDGQPEVLIASASEGMYIAHTGPESFRSVVAAGFIGERSVFQLALADLDNDGDQDLLTHDQHVITVFCNDGSGDFTEVGGLSSGQVSSRPLFGTTDVDNDGDLDVVEIYGDDLGGVAVFPGATED